MKFWEGRSWFLPLIAIVITLVFIEVFDDVGAITSVVVLVTGWLWLVEQEAAPHRRAHRRAHRPRVYLLFDKFLKTPFPRGLLF